MNKEQILKHVEDLTAEQLFEYVKPGIVTLTELKETGRLDVRKRTMITEFQKQLDLQDEEAWKRAQYGNEMMLSDYISHYPAGKYVPDAKEKIQYLEQARRQAQADKQGILEKLQRNPNTCSPGTITDYLQNGTITKDELLNCGIPNDIIECINTIQSFDLELGETPKAIPAGFTEVYFWGIPGSGKTCALAAILSTADHAGLLNIVSGPGYDYMTRLKNIFIEKPAILPPPSPVDTTQYLPFTLKKKDEKYPRSISLIELSGEIFQCFYYRSARQPFFSQSHQDTFETLERFLKGNNRKIHFFFIDYEKENKKDMYGLLQGDYLAAATEYFRQNDIFKKNTDAIFVVLTKSDLMPCSAAEREKEAINYLNNQNFKSFYFTLRDRCKQHSINSGHLTIEPFSLGKVYFQQICDFDNNSATKFLDIFMERIAKNSKSILDIFNK